MGCIIIKDSNLALAVALKLNIDETKDLLSRAGQMSPAGGPLFLDYCLF